ncbi:hypothetical protein Tco_1141384 [Tanacetum coccineum]
MLRGGYAYHIVIRSRSHGIVRKSGSSSITEESIDEHKIGDEYLTEKQQQQQLDLDEEALRETLEEEARAEKEWEERIKQEQAHYELFRLEFGVKSYSEYESD